MIPTVTDVTYHWDVALVTIHNIPNTPEHMAKILREMAKRQVPVDMICRGSGNKGRCVLSFSVPQENLADVIGATAAFRTLDAGISTEVNGNNVKVVFSGDRMADAYGVAADLFERLAEAEISVKLITTAETEISCLVDIKDICRVRDLSIKKQKVLS